MSVQTFNIALPRELVKAVDRQAKKEYRSRSELIREAIRAYLIEMNEWEDIFSYGRKIGKKMGIKSEEDVNRIVEEYRSGE